MKITSMRIKGRTPTNVEEFKRSISEAYAKLDKVT